VIWSDNRGLHAEAIDGARPRLLVPGGGPAVWSPDSKNVLVPVSSGTRLAVVSVATGAERPLVTPRARPHVTYSARGWSGPAHEILYSAYDQGGADASGCCSDRLIVATPRGTSPHVLYNAGDPLHDGADVAWSPAGKWVAFTTQRYDPRDPRLAIVDMASRKTMRVHAYGGLTPVWAPDSNRFASGGRSVDVFSSHGARLSTVGGQATGPYAWTRAGLYFASGLQGGRSKIHLVQPGRTAARTVFALPADMGLLELQALG
jgi:hypothetical protein